MTEAPARLAPRAWWIAIAAALLQWRGVAGPHLFDAGELVTAAWELGGSHPPGQPLHALAGQLASLLPLGPAPWRITWVSAGGAGLAAWCAGRLTGLALERSEPTSTTLRRIAPDAVALGVLLAPPVLRQVARPEVYPLALALTAYALLELVRWGSRAPDASAALRRAALATGLCVAVHPPHAFAVLAAALAITALVRREVLRRPRTVAWAVAAGVAGLLAHVYLPVRAHAGAPMWGTPQTWAGFVDYVSGTAYRGNLGAGEQGWLANVAHVLGYTVLAAAVVPVAGLVLLWLRDRGRDDPPVGAIATAAVVGTSLAAFLQPLDEKIPDQVAWTGPAVIMLLAGGAAGIARLGSSRPAVAVGALALLPLAFNPAGLSRASEALRADAPVLETLGGALVDTPPPRALLVVETDFVAATWMMARAVDGTRPDVALLVGGLSTSSWHWRSLASHPLFDGTPVEGRGRDAYAAYVDGAVRRAGGRVAIASETDAPIRGRGSLAGPYLVLPAAGDVQAVLAQTTGERLAPHIDRELARGPSGDHDTVGAVVRHYQSGRARRLVVRRRVPAAGGALARALYWIPERERAPLRELSGAPRRPPPLVDDPEAFLTSRAELVREAALLAWATGSRQAALGLLEGQLERGHPRSLLQLAWLHLDAGAPDRARQALAAFDEQAPELAEQARPLRRRLERVSP